MISRAHLVVVRADAGKPPSIEDLDAVPSGQWSDWFTELAPLCHDRINLGVEPRPGNALNIEIGAPLPRCKRQSPDGRGLAWLHSGGSPLAYGTCSRGACPRMEATR